MNLDFSFVWSKGAGKSPPPKYEVIEVTFEKGPLNMLLGHDHTKKKIIVQGFKNTSDGHLGVAEASGKIKINDELVAVNSKTIRSKSLRATVSLIMRSLWPMTLQLQRLETTSADNSQSFVNIETPGITVTPSQHKGMANPTGYTGGGGAAAPPRPAPGPGGGSGPGGALGSGGPGGGGGGGGLAPGLGSALDRAAARAAAQNAAVVSQAARLDAALVRARNGARRRARGIAAFHQEMQKLPELRTQLLGMSTKVRELRMILLMTEEMLNQKEQEKAQSRSIKNHNNNNNENEQKANRPKSGGLMSGLLGSALGQQLSASALAARAAASAALPAALLPGPAAPPAPPPREGGGGGKLGSQDMGLDHRPAATARPPLEEKATAAAGAGGSSDGSGRSGSMQMGGERPVGGRRRRVRDEAADAQLQQRAGEIAAALEKEQGSGRPSSTLNAKGAGASIEEEGLAGTDRVNINKEGVEGGHDVAAGRRNDALHHPVSEETVVSRKEKSTEEEGIHEKNEINNKGAEERQISDMDDFFNAF